MSHHRCCENRKHICCLWLQYHNPAYIITFHTTYTSKHSCQTLLLNTSSLINPANNPISTKPSPHTIPILRKFSHDRIPANSSHAGPQRVSVKNRYRRERSRLIEFRGLSHRRRQHTRADSGMSRRPNTSPGGPEACDRRISPSRRAVA